MKLSDKTVMRAGYALMYAGSSGSAGMEGYRGNTGMLSTLDGGRTVNAYLSNPFPSSNRNHSGRHHNDADKGIVLPLPRKSTTKNSLSFAEPAVPSCRTG